MEVNPGAHRPLGNKTARLAPARHACTVLYIYIYYVKLQMPVKVVQGLLVWSFAGFRTIRSHPTDPPPAKTVAEVSIRGPPTSQVTPPRSRRMS